MKRLLEIVKSFLIFILVLFSAVLILGGALGFVRGYIAETLLGLDRMGCIIMASAGAVLMILGIAAIAFSRNDDSSREICIKMGQDGMVSISEEALVALAGCAVRIIPQVKGYDVKLAPAEKNDENEGIAFNVEVSMFQNAAIPAVTEKLIRDVSEIVEGRTGIKVNGVNVLVKDSVKEQEQTKLTRVK